MSFIKYNRMLYNPQKMTVGIMTPNILRCRGFAKLRGLLNVSFEEYAKYPLIKKNNGILNTAQKFEITEWCAVR